MCGKKCNLSNFSLGLLYVCVAYVKTANGIKNLHKTIIVIAKVYQFKYVRIEYLTGIGKIVANCVAFAVENEIRNDGKVCNEFCSCGEIYVSFVSDFQNKDLDF